MRQAKQNPNREEEGDCHDLVNLLNPKENMDFELQICKEKCHTVLNHFRNLSSQDVAFPI